MVRLVTVAACALRQWSLDWAGNAARIILSIREAKEAGASLRVGPELEIPGYECQDHFLEQDLYLHCWDMLESILRDDTLHGIMLDIGMPVQHRNVRYNCRIICVDGKILLIRPKMWLAGSGNYYEPRHFTPWMKPQKIEQYLLPRRLQKLQGATHVNFGDAVISTPDPTCLAAETCEELFTPDAPHISQALDGVEIFTNSSASHFTLRKLGLRLQLIQEATRKSGGIYIYANQHGCGGDRLYFDGSAMILVNGEVVAQGSQFSLKEVETVSATIDLDEVQAYRSSASRCLQAAMSTASYERIETPFTLGSYNEDLDLRRRPSPPIAACLHVPEEEIALCAACYLWDYLRRSGAAGYLLPLSGGIDSCATAVLVFSMCRLVIKEMKAGNESVTEDVKRLAKFSNHLPESAEDLCDQIFHTIYLGMSRQSSRDTRQRARDLSNAIGAYHINLDIDKVYEAQKNLIGQALDGFEPRFAVDGGTKTENLVLQNIQARTRMVTSYEFAQILPTTRGSSGSLLVLASANVGEALRGYLTKYGEYPDLDGQSYEEIPLIRLQDCSSGDVNPIGAIDKQDLVRLIAWAEVEYELPCLQGFLTAVPTAELEPLSDSYTQSDEQDMGLSYAELTVFGRLRKENRLGPFGVFQKLVHDWSDARPCAAGEIGLSPREVAEKVKRFFYYHMLNRHKMTTITPSVHCNDYSPDDNRFDQRPFLYPPQYGSYPFILIDKEVEKFEKLRDNERESRT